MIDPILFALPLSVAAVIIVSLLTEKGKNKIYYMLSRACNSYNCELLPYFNFFIFFLYDSYLELMSLTKL